MTDINQDLNATIAAAVQAKVEASVIAALAGDEVLGKYVAAALNQVIEVGNSYNKVRTTYLRHTIDEALRAAVKVAVAKFIENETALLEAEVAKALRKQAAKIANQFVTHLAETTVGRSYGVDVHLKMRGE
jgi:capsular polysaccharide biosynthesis protein